MNMIQLRQLKKKLISCKRDNKKPYYMTFVIENGIIKYITVSEKKDSPKTYTEASEGFVKWKTYILSDDILKEHIEASKSLFCIITDNGIINAYTDERGL